MIHERQPIYLPLHRQWFSVEPNDKGNDFRTQMVTMGEWCYRSEKRTVEEKDQEVEEERIKRFKNQRQASYTVDASSSATAAAIQVVEGLRLWNRQNRTGANPHTSREGVTRKELVQGQQTILRAQVALFHVQQGSDCGVLLWGPGATKVVLREERTSEICD